MKKFLRHKSILFLLTIVFAVAGAGASIQNVTAMTAAEISAAVDVAAQVAYTAEVAVDTAQTAVDTAQTDYNTTLTWFNSIPVGDTMKGSAQISLNNATTNLNNANTALITAQGNLLAANTALTTAQAEKSDETVAAEAAATAADAIPGSVPTSLVTTPDTAGAQGVWTGTEWGTQSSSQATYDACASVPDVVTSATDTATGAEVTTTTKCDGTMTVKSTTKNADGTKTVVTTEKDASGTVIGTPTTETKASTATTDSEKKLLATLKVGCGWSNPFSMGCLAQIPYYLVYKPMSRVLEISGYIFDATITLSISKKYVDEAFVSTVWKIIRDFSNMIFIFVLLYTGIQTMLGMGDWRKTVLHIIIIALLINFSLFFTKVVIDAGNILAVGIFQAMGTEKTTANTSIIPAGSGVVTERSLSGAIVANFQPSKFLSKASATEPWNAAIIFIIAAIVNGFAAYILFKVSLLFIGRLLAFWVLMIISPFAFISFVLPGKANIFHWWTSNLTRQAFVAPVFLFLLYLLMTVINSGIMSGFAASTGTTITDFLFDTLLGPILVTALLLVALQKILTTTTAMSGEFGAAAAEYAGKAVGLAGGAALGVASGGASFAMRGAMGSAATRFAGTGIAKKWTTSDSKIGQWAGRQAMDLTDKAKTGTWDIRGSSIAQKTLGKGLGAVGIGLGKPWESAAGGYEGAQKRQEDADLSLAKRLEVTDAEKRRWAGDNVRGYEEAIADQEKNKAEELSTKRELEKAKEEVKNSSEEGKRVSAAKKDLTEKEKEEKETTKNKQEIAVLEKMKSETVFPEEKAEIDKKIKELNETITKAADARKKAAKELTDATAALAGVIKNSKKVIAVTEKADKIEENIKKAKEVIVKGNAEAAKWAKGETSDRRESIAQQIESRHQTGSLDSTPVSVGFNSEEAQEATAKKIRGGDVDRIKLEKEKGDTIKKFKESLELSSDDPRGLDDTDVAKLVEEKKENLTKAVDEAEVSYDFSAEKSPERRAAIIAKNKAVRDLKEFTESLAKIKTIEKELKEKEK